MDQEQATIIALDALAFIAADSEALSGFLRLSGLDLTLLKERADNPETLGFVLEFLLQNETRLLQFCQTNGINPALPAKARRHLPGGILLSDTT